MSSSTFRPFAVADVAPCLALFDMNAPEFFALNERDDYESFLKGKPVGYEVCLLDGQVVGAFGLLSGERPGRAQVRWIVLDPDVQGRGLGSAVMGRMLQSARARGVRVIEIAASHHSEGFFGRFGAVVRRRTEHGWGPDMHRVDMELEVGA